MNYFGLAAVCAFAAIILFFNVSSAFAEKKKIGWVFIVSGVLLSLFTLFFIYKAYNG